MALYVLDTDSLTLLREGHAELGRRTATLPPDELATTVITVEEHLTGWYSLIRRVRRPEQIEIAYQELANATQFCGRITLLTYTRQAVARFEELRGLRLNIGGMDLRIAAIVLEAGGVLISRNLRDFQRVPGLVVEDWTVPQSGETA